ncbi:nucleoside 2-deoxyribosyltransferase [Elizabethkingia bruuniana]|uniref:Nucleoside 2-deoxyribosyltransferase n=1 Tax=Elizabethkingia bruuniana TaxID=1756149 RepID=A0A7T7UYY5_9FLAO|nr:PfkB family carbohydrate kinase [Elizabethkingia bruuniana]AQX85143.1 hypothetical protein AYC65_09050 [Elizabethkingia bruuniana]KUY28670.1 hypothetical protein ATB97_00620 [Elizabethkingia bruuniana]OPB70300.1 hypothetical protein BAY12_16730 [Elizabethkingia bruuniana]QQN58634.1 nucleoside 2-deoxyribosyltransferase [Elizabethkingia bruuniana]
MISVIGGVYREINLDDLSTEIYGSGLRCTKFLLENKCDVIFHTAGNSEIEDYLKEYKKVYPSFSFSRIDYNELITFKYSYALDQPDILPNPLKIRKTKNIEFKDYNIICYGMLETDFKVEGCRVVYDTQNSINPIKFSEFGVADELIYIINFSEAKVISKCTELEDIKKFFFEEEKVTALIIKNGPHGATLLYDNKEVKIPSYITENVHKIGSGDIFTASFAYYWMEKKISLEDCAYNASKSTSYFCDKKIYIDTSNIENLIYKEYHPSNLNNKQIYLASPFFSISELLLVDKIRNSFLEFDVNVFSPFHDIGIGNDITIANKDIDAINNSDIIFCVFDGLDSGTLVEAGYSIAKNKKIIGYQRTCDENKLLMIKPGNAKVYENLTTAIYQTIWSL